MADLEYSYGKTGLPGAALQGEGVRTPFRLDRTGAIAAALAHGEFYEACSRGTLFSVANQVGVASQTTLSLTTPVLTLYNPLGSGVNLGLIYAGVVQTVAPAAAIAVHLAANTNTAAAAVTGTATTAHRNLLLGGPAPKATPFLAATLPAAPVSIDVMGGFFAAALTVANQNPAIGKWYNGSIILKENTAISIQTVAASGALALFCTYVWEETPNA